MRLTSVMLTRARRTQFGGYRIAGCSLIVIAAEREFGPGDGGVACVVDGGGGGGGGPADHHPAVEEPGQGVASPSALTRRPRLGRARWLPGSARSTEVTEQSGSSKGHTAPRSRSCWPRPRPIAQAASIEGLRETAKLGPPVKLWFGRRREQRAGQVLRVDAHVDRGRRSRSVVVRRLNLGPGDVPARARR